MLVPACSCWLRACVAWKLAMLPAATAACLHRRTIHLMPFRADSCTHLLARLPCLMLGSPEKMPHESFAQNNVESSWETILSLYLCVDTHHTTAAAFHACQLVVQKRLIVREAASVPVFAGKCSCVKCGCTCNVYVRHLAVKNVLMCQTLDLVCQMGFLLRAMRCGILSESRQAQPGILYFVLFYLNFMQDSARHELVSGADLYSLEERLRFVVG